MKQFWAIFMAVVLALTGFLTAPTVIFGTNTEIETDRGQPATDELIQETDFDSEPVDQKTDLFYDEDQETMVRSSDSNSPSRGVHHSPDEYPDANKYFLVSESIDSVASGRYLDGLPVKSDGRDTKLNKADLYLPNPNTVPPRVGYDVGNRMYFRFPRNPGTIFNANYNESFMTPPFINITFNTLYSPLKEINIEILIDADGNFNVNNPNMANIEGVIQFPLYTTTKPAPNWDVQMEETFESNGTWANTANIPKQIRNGAIYLSLWRTDNTFDLGVPFNPDLLVYAGFTNKSSWMALPYEHTVSLPHIEAAYDFIKDETYRWYAIDTPPSAGLDYDEVPEYMKMKPYDTITFNASKSYDPNDDFNGNKNIDDGVPSTEKKKDGEVDTLSYKWDFGDGKITAWLPTPITNHKYEMDVSLRERYYNVTLWVRNRMFHVVSDTCQVRIFNEEHPPVITDVTILPQSVDPSLPDLPEHPRAVINQMIQITGDAKDTDPWDLNDLRFYWDLNGDGKTESFERGETVSTSFSSKGTKTLRLWVYDGDPGNTSTFSDYEEKTIYISDNVKPVAKILAGKNYENPVSKSISVTYGDKVIFNTTDCYDPDMLPGFDISKPKDFKQDYSLSYRWHFNWKRENETLLMGSNPYSDENIVSSWSPNITTPHIYSSQDYYSEDNYRIYVFLEVDDGEDITASDVFTVYLNLRPQADFYINDKTDLSPNQDQPFIGEMIDFDASLSYDPNDDANGDGSILPPEVDRLTYTWFFDDGVSEEGKEVTHAFAKQGEHRIVLTVSDGELTASKERYIIIRGEDKPPIIVIDITPKSGATHYPFSFKASDSYDPDKNDLVVKFHWKFGDGKESFEADTSHSYSEEGLYTISLEIWDRHGRSTINMNHTVLVFNRAPIVSLNLKSEGEVGKPVKMSASAEDPDGEDVEFYWDFGDSSSDRVLDWSDNNSVTHIYEEPGTYTVFVEVRDDTGQLNITSGVIEIKIDQGEPTPKDDILTEEFLFWLVIVIIIIVIAVAIVGVIWRIRREVL